MNIGGDSVAAIGHATAGDHLCWVYNDDATFRAVLARYITDGLAAGERVACYVPEPSIDRLRRLLSQVYPRLEHAIGSGALLLGPALDAYMPDGSFDPQQRLDGYAAMSAAAAEDGFSALRVMGEATDMVRDPAARALWPSYEVRAGLLTTRMPILALCGFDSRRCDPDAMALVRSVHATAIGPWIAPPTYRLHPSPTGSLVVAGEVDFGCADLFARIARDAAADTAEPVLDVSELSFIDVAGMRAVVEALRSLAHEHGSVSVRGAGATFRRLWSLLGCDAQVEVRFEP